MRKFIGASFLIFGTTVGAGMLGIPLFTASGGFWPAMGITVAAWAIMLWTGLLFLEATLWMPLGSNLLSMSKRFFGSGGRWFSGMMFLFLYYCLLVAYYAAGSPMLAHIFTTITGVPVEGTLSYILFGLIFGSIIALGAHWIDRVNLILTVGMALTYLLLFGSGAPVVVGERYFTLAWPSAIFAMPILFSAFGFHNIIPSLCTYLGKDKRLLRNAVILGSLLSLITYLLWQWLVIGIIPSEAITRALSEGKPVTAALKESTGNPWIYLFGQSFAFFAIITSLLGISFSMVDFLADGMKTERKGMKRIGLVLITLVPPLILARMYPKAFDTALGIAGGIGEAILNGLVPIALVWVGKYYRQLPTMQLRLGAHKFYLSALTLIILAVMGIEVFTLGKH